MSLFPIFLKLAARPCVVVGAGNIAESKIESLLQAEAHVTVIAPDALCRTKQPGQPVELCNIQCLGPALRLYPRLRQQRLATERAKRAA